MSFGNACFALAVVLATSMQSATPVASAPVTQGDQGLDGGWPIDDSGNVSFVHSLSSGLGTAQNAGAGWVRTVFRLGACYPNWTSTGCDGRTALQAYDQVVLNIHAHNLRVLGTINNESWPGSQTDWTANNAETVAGGTGDNAYVQAFAQQAASVLAAHFAGQISDWEIWNEPNAWTSTDGLGHFSGSSYLYPSNYAFLIQRSYQAIKSAQPTSQVLFGGLFAHEPFGVPAAVVINGHVQHVIKRSDMPGARRPPVRPKTLAAAGSLTCSSHVPAGADSGASYLCATYSVGLGYANWTPGAYPFDEVGQHPYVDIGQPLVSSTLSTYLGDLRQAYTAYEGISTPKRTVVSEIGWPTDQVTLQVQSDNVKTAFQTLQATSYVARSFWFQIQDIQEAGLYFGLVDNNGVPKPAFATYQQYATFESQPTSLIHSLGQPQRLVDTRTSGGPIAGGSSRCFSIGGQAGIPSDAAGVVLNVTAVGYGSKGWLTLYPNGQSVPATSTLNFDVSEYAIANGAIVRIGTGGQVCVAAAPGNSNVLLDATGYLTISGIGQMPLLDSPQRLADTRVSGGPIAAGSSRCFSIGGQAGIPSDAAGVVLNVTAVGYGSKGWLTLYPNGQSVPATSTLNFDVSEYAIANGAIVRIGTGGQVCVAAAPGNSNVLLDATGYLTISGIGQMPLLDSPQRLADTRVSGGPIAAGSSRCFSIGGQAGIPSDAAGVVLNVTAVGYGSKGWLTLYPNGQSVPATSTLNFDVSEYAIANGAIMSIGTGGQVCVNVQTPSAPAGGAHVVLDAVGYLAH